MNPPVRLPPRYGPELTPIGSGGFGAVYRTQDHELGVPVAVKVPFRSGSGDLSREVMLELRASAVLRHPGFVQILDAGIDGDGVPFLVMELAERGSLDGMLTGSPRSWAEITPIASGLLEGLAYAHARGLVHRDVKPANVLLTGTGPHPLPKLADFGLAKLTQQTGGYQSTRLAAGTILYMAPEAFDQDTSCIHPGVDLYAFGVLLHELVTGSSPWSQTDLALLMAKVQGGRRPLKLPQQSDAPSWLPEVLDRLLEPDPARRFNMAAEVHRELFPEQSGATLRLPAGNTTGDGSINGAAWQMVPLPAAPPEPIELPSRPITTALAVVREPRLVDREQERRLLWEAAHDATAGPTGVALTGPLGVGRSRLRRWLLETLDEQGSARTLQIRLDGRTPVADATARAIRSFLGLGAATGAWLGTRLEAWMAARGPVRHGDVEALVGWLDPATRSERSLADPREATAQRIALVDRILRLEASRGLVCASLEELEADSGGVDFAAALLRSARGEPFPLLVVYEVTGLRTEPPALDGFREIAVGPLAATDVQLLLQDLGLGPGQAEALAARVRGLPLPAVESARLMGTRDRLAEHSMGGETTVEAPAPTGDDALLMGYAETLEPARIASIRLQSFFDAAADRDGAAARSLAVTLLSLLPRPCKGALLAQVAQANGLAAVDAVETALEDARFAGLASVDADGSLDFAGAPMSGAAVELADGRPDIAALRLACADFLLVPDATVGHVRHAARLLVAAGRPLQGLDVLMPVGAALIREDADAAVRVWTEAAEAADAAGLDPQDQRRIQIVLGTARAARALGEIDRAQGLLSAIDPAGLEVAERGEWNELRASVLLLTPELEAARLAAEEAVTCFTALERPRDVVRARVLAADALFRSGRWQEAIPVFRTAIDEAADAGAVRELVGARWLLARSLRRAGELGPAESELRATLELARERGMAAVEGSALRELGNIAVRAGRTDEADGLYRESTERLEAAGLRGESAVTRNSRGELARARGDLAAARKEYAAALARTRAYGLVSESIVNLVNLGITELGMGRARRAGTRVAEIDQVLPPGTQHGLRTYVEALRLAVLASEGSWEDAEDLLSELAPVGKEPRADPDLLWLLETTGEKAAADDEIPLAGDAWALALRMARDLHDDDATARLIHRLEAAG